VVSALAVGLALVVAGGALLLLRTGPAHRSAAAHRPTSPPASASIALCGQGSVTVGRRGRPSTVATGSISAHRWRLLSYPLPPPFGGVASGVLSVHGHEYPLCGAMFIGLVNAPGNGLAFGFVPVSGGRAVRVEKRAPTTVRAFRAGTFFLALLPRPACSYRTLSLSSSGRDTSVATSQTFGRCPGRWQLVPTAVPSGLANAVQVPAPAGLRPGARSRFRAGAVVAGESGCLACHAIAGQGNNGPGPPLTNIGKLLRPATIRSALLHPRAPMPSFRGLSESRLRALVYFLTELRGQ
jgi:mono/diheme cytochrome c family protein